MRVICIGAGAAGLFFSLNASRSGVEVTILESNPKPGKKLAITGKGRCNITNNKSVNDFINHVVRNPKFLYSSLNQFTPQDTMEFFENHGCPLKVERGDRVFPVSDKSSSIIDTLVSEAKKAGVIFKYNEKVISCAKVGDEFIIKTKTGEYRADKLVIATGGKSYPLTGSLGDGYKFATSFGHKIIDLKPALCPIKIKEKIHKEMLEFTLKNVEILAESQHFKKKIFGDLEFLPNSITGPISLTLSSLINRFDEVKLTLDFKPALDNEKLSNRILREITKTPNEDARHLISTLLPKEVREFFIENTNFDLNKQLNSFSRQERLDLINKLKHFKLTFDGLEDLDKAVVTSGGVDVNELNQKALESKLVPGLYFVGEVIDVDAFTGGYSLQIALSTAFAAAKHINSI